MGISRLIILVLLGLAAWWLWKKVKTVSAGQSSDRLSRTTAMVRCQHCQLHLTQPEAIRHQNRWYCSETHAKAGPARQ